MAEIHILFSFDVCLFVCAQQTDQSDYSLKQLTLSDFKSDMHVPRDSP